MWRSVVLALINVSEERIVSIFRVENLRAGNQRFYPEDGGDIFL
jgi:hypothetical protein